MVVRGVFWPIFGLRCGSQLGFSCPSGPFMAAWLAKKRPKRAGEPKLVTESRAQNRPEILPTIIGRLLGRDLVTNLGFLALRGLFWQLRSRKRHRRAGTPKLVTKSRHKNRPGNPLTGILTLSGCLYTLGFLIFDRPEIVDFGGLGGPGRPGDLPKRWGASVSRLPGAAQTPQIDDLRSVKKSYIRNLGVGRRLGWQHTPRLGSLPGVSSGGSLEKGRKLGIS